MSVKIMGQVWDLDMPPNNKFVLLAYADHADHAGNNVFPSVSMIAKKTGYGERQIKRIKQELINAGYLVEVTRPSGKAVKYRIECNPCQNVTSVKMSPGTSVKMSPGTSVKMSPGLVTFATGTSDIGTHKAVLEPSIKPSIDSLESDPSESNTLTSFGNKKTSHTSATKNDSASDDDSESDDVEKHTQAADYYNSDYEAENNNSHYKGVRAVPKPAPKQKKSKATLGRRQQATSDEQDDSHKPRYTPPRPTVVPAVQKREKTPLKAESGFVAWVKEQWGGSTIKDEAKAVLEANADMFEMEGFKEWAAAVIQESNDYTKTEYNKPRSSSVTIAGRVTDREAFEAWKVEKSAEVAKEKAQEYDDNIIELTPEELERLLEAKRRKKEAQGA